MLSRLFYLTWFPSQNSGFNLKSFKEILWKRIIEAVVHQKVFQHNSTVRGEQVAI